MTREDLRVLDEIDLCHWVNSKGYAFCGMVFCAAHHQGWLDNVTATFRSLK